MTDKDVRDIEVRTILLIKDLRAQIDESKMVLQKANEITNRYNKELYSTNKEANHATGNN